MTSRNKSRIWPVVKFGDVVENINAVERNPLDAGLERLVGLEHMDGENLHIRRWGLIEDSETTFTKRFCKGQVLFGKRRAYQRKVAVAEFDGICSSDILTFQPKGDALIPELLPFIVQSDGFFEHALGTSAGSLSPRTRWSQLVDYEFPLPPKDEQRRIAEILWAADEVKHNHYETAHRLDDLEAAVFADFLHNGADKDRSEKIDTRFGVLPSHWRVASISEVAEVAYGVSEAVAGNHDPSLGWPILTGANITLAGSLDLTKIVYIEPPTKPDFVLRRGDLLFNWRSGSVEHVGKTAVFDLDGNWTFASFILRIRPSSQLNRVYLHRLLNYMRKRQLLGPNTSQQVNFKMNAAMLRQLGVIVPPLDEQHWITKKMEEVDCVKNQVAGQAAVVSNLTKTLIRSFLAGEVVQ